MADKFLNLTAVQTIKTWADGKYALDADLDTLSERVDDIVAEGGEPNKIDSITFNAVPVAPDANKNVALEGAILSVSGDTATVSQPQNTFTVRMLNSAGQPLPNATDLVNFEFEENAYSAPTKEYMEDYVDENGGKIASISIDGTAQTIDANKNVALDLSDYAKGADIPTATSALTNDSDFQTGTEVQTAIDNALADVTGIDFQVVQTLPATGEKGVIYLLANSGSGSNIYDEYIWLDGDPTGRFEKIGTTEVDLSNYWTSTTGQSNTLEAATVAEINAILNA